LFVDAAAGNFHLAYGSPCIDTGTNLSRFISSDLDANPRPLDGDWDGVAAFDMGAYEYDPHKADSNTDGIPDWWCRHYVLDPTQPGLAGANPDHDPFSTFQEWLADTDPTDADSQFRIVAIDPGPPVVVYLATSSNRVYTLRACTALGVGDWSDVPGQTNLRGSGGTDALRDTSATPQRFYRVEVKLP